jgi:hypothetical protein
VDDRMSCSRKNRQRVCVLLAFAALELAEGWPDHEGKDELLPNNRIAMTTPSGRITCW